jgi:ribonuclease HI
MLVSPTNLGGLVRKALANTAASIQLAPCVRPRCGLSDVGVASQARLVELTPVQTTLLLEGRNLRECLVIYVDAALDKNGRAGCGLAVFVRGRAVYTESFGFSHLGGSAQLEAHVCAGALDLAAARWPYHRVIVRTDCAPVVRSRMPSSDSFRIAVFEVRERCRRGWRVVRYVSRKANPAHELAREGLKSLSRQQVLVAA